MNSSRNVLTRIYADRIDADGHLSDAYGYWVLVFAMILGIAGIALFLSGSTNPRGEGTYWTYREFGVILASVSLSLVFFALTVRLPLQPAAAVIGSVGVTLCLTAVAWFALLYPFGWTFAGPRPVILLYTSGLILFVVALIAVPIMARPVATIGARTHIGQPYYELREASDVWTWRLYDTDGTRIAESATTFPTRDAARDAIEDVATSAPTAGTALTARPEA